MDFVTGGEIVAAGKTAEAIGKKMLAAGEKTNDVLLRIAEERQTPELVAAARSRAARIAVLERIKLLLLWPLARMFGISRVLFEDTFSQETAADDDRRQRLGRLAKVLVQLGYSSEIARCQPHNRELWLVVAEEMDRRLALPAHVAQPGA